MKDKKILVNKQTGGLIAKNVIIFIVLIAVCSLSIWAWFTQNTKATADGINITSKAEGVKVSWDGTNYYDNLTALESTGVVAEKTGLAKNICNEDGTPYSLNLISGNGLTFFEPNLNRRTGTVLTNSDDSWQGLDVTNTPEGKYIDIDLYFRGENKRDVYLAGDSKIDPKSTDERISDFGTFSKDYIAAASRVAFLSADKKSVSFIWAPNANVELVENTAGYTKVTNKVTEEVTVSGDGSITLGGEEGEITTVTYFPLDNNVNCALVNPKDGVAVSSDKHKSVQFKDSSSKLNVLPISITTAEQFTVVKNGDGYSATYKFMNTANGKYLTIDNGAISYTVAGSAFSLYYSEDFEGPLLKSGDYYLVVDGGDVTAVNSNDLETADAVTVYTGSSYELNTNLTSDSQPYQYYDADTNELVTLSASSAPKLFTTTQSTSETVKVGDTKIATLAKEKETDEYYTAHIVMRVWVEGTDREAKTPLADGVFDMSLHFISQ